VDVKFWVVVVALVAAVFLGRKAAVRLTWRLMNWAVADGHTRLLLGLTHVENFLTRSRGVQLTKRWLQLISLSEQGKLHEAIPLAQSLVAQLDEQPFYAASQLNAVVTTFISAGLYEEALATFRNLPASRRKALLDEVPEVDALIVLNLAEALYNLGRWREAWDSMASLNSQAWANALVWTGLSQQRAWIAIHEGRFDEALALLNRIKKEALPSGYWSEHHFTRALAHLGRGELADARREAEMGLELALRPASKRNARFILARVCLSEGQLEEAERLCREAAHDAYQWQGGEGLLLWGEILIKLQRSGEARHAFWLATQRDPQSESAASAKELLAHEGNGWPPAGGLMSSAAEVDLRCQFARANRTPPRG
jgi:tetratricopeptide (TPR) repeat protein